MTQQKFSVKKWALWGVVLAQVPLITLLYLCGERYYNTGLCKMTASVNFRFDLTGKIKVSPGTTWQSAQEAGVTAHTFEQQGVNNHSHIRRFLFYRPKNNQPNTVYPLVIFLTGSAANAEISRQFDSHATLERLADQHKFYVAYANPLSSKSILDRWPFFAHIGNWRTSIKNDGVINDIEYIGMLIDNIETHYGKIDYDNIFLIGLSGGANLAIDAALADPLKYRAIAAASPSSQHLTSKGKRRLPPLLLSYGTQDPQYDDNYPNQMQQFINRWLEQARIELPYKNTAQLTDPVHEGENYTGEIPAALRTRNSNIIRTDHKPKPNSSPHMTVLEITNGGHGYPHPEQFIMSVVENQKTGFKNQDIDASEMIWAFFSDLATGAKANTP